MQRGEVLIGRRLAHAEKEILVSIPQYGDNGVVEPLTQLEGVPANQQDPLQLPGVGLRQAREDSRPSLGPEVLFDERQASLEHRAFYLLHVGGSDWSGWRPLAVSS